MKYDNDWPVCEVCDKVLSGFKWTDTHGVGVCYTCGAPYQIYHYEKDENGKKRQVEKPWEPVLRKSGIELARRYWSETHQRVFPGALDMGIIGNSDRTYSGATRKEISDWMNWMDKQPENAALSAVKAA